MHSHRWEWWRDRVYGPERQLISDYRDFIVPVASF